MKVRLTQQDLAEVVFSTNEDTRNRFRETFGEEFEEFLDSIFQPYERLIEFEDKMEEDERPAWVHRFLFNAFNNLLISFHLLISGFVVPAGNLMRQHAESVAMALLCSHRKIETFQKFVTNPQKFRMDKSLKLVNNNASLLNVDAEGWQGFQDISKWYNNYSHASVTALANLQLFNTPSGLVVGSEFDPGKVDAYRKEIRLRIDACKSLFGTIKQAEQHLITIRDS
jgi:hypothetical protein